MMRIVSLSSYYSRASSSSGRSFVRAALLCSAPSSWQGHKIYKNSVASSEYFPFEVKAAVAELLRLKALAPAE